MSIESLTRKGNLNMNAQPYHHIVRIVGDRTKNGKLMKLN